MRFAAATAVATLIASLALAQSYASRGKALDPDDTAGPLDLAEASVHEQSGRTKRRFIVLRLRTYERWNPRELASEPSSAPSFLSFEFDRDGDAPAARCFDIKIESDGALVGRMVRPCIPRPFAHEFGPSIRLRRPDARRVKAVVPLRLLGRKPRSYGWRAASAFEAAGDQDCEPQLAPPERRYLTCTDFTRRARIGP